MVLWVFRAGSITWTMAFSRAYVRLDWVCAIYAICAFLFIRESCFPECYHSYLYITGCIVAMYELSNYTLELADRKTLYTQRHRSLMRLLAK